MRKWFTTGSMMALFLGAMIIHGANAQSIPFQDRPLYSPHELVIAFIPDAAPAVISQLRQQHDMITQYVSPFDGLEIISLPEGVDVRAKLEELKGHPLIKYVNFNYLS